ncbi:MAG: diacylglycerol kinase family protein [Thermoanaerobaculia bacterium]
MSVPAPRRRRALLIWNPRAGQRVARRSMPEIRRVLSSEFDLTVEATSGPEHCREIARRAVAERFELFIVVGGDGTLRVAASVLAGTDVVLGAIPGGTTNVVAGALGLPVHPVAAARALVVAETREIDLGESNGEPFLMQLSGGLDAQVMAHVNLRTKRLLGKGAVALAGLSEWFRYRFPQFTLEIDGVEAMATGFVVANLPQYAGQFEIVPQARPDDRRLELLLFHGRRRRDAVGFALALARGRHLERSDVELRSFTTLRLTSPAALQLQADGDAFVAAAPLVVGLAAKRLKVLAARS